MNEPCKALMGWRPYVPSEPTFDMPRPKKRVRDPDADDAPYQAQAPRQPKWVRR